MARIRTIKPEFWLNEELASVSEPARLVAIGLLNLADDEGWFKAHSRLVESALFPFSEPSVSIHECLTQLSSIGYIATYIGTDSKQYGHVVKFDEHQRVNRPSPSKIGPLIVFSEQSVSNHGALTAGKERKGKEQGKEGNGKEMKIVKESISCGFERFWLAGMTKQNKQGALKSFTKQHKESKQEIEIFTDYLINDVQQRLSAGVFGFDKMHPTTYLNQQRWHDDIVKLTNGQQTNLMQTVNTLQDMQLSSQENAGALHHD
jgi:hypothetical protein